MTAVLGALLGACVGATTQLPPLPPGAVEAEQEKQRELAIQDNERQQTRLDSIAYPILSQATALCSTAQGPVLGLRLATIHNYEKEWRPAATRVLGLNDALTIVGVIPGSPAALAGLLPGDQVHRIGSRSIPEGPDATKTFAEAVGELKDQNAGMGLPILFSRAGVQRAATLSLISVCTYGTMMVNTDELNAFADGERIYVTSTMMRFASDQELRVVVAHEFAHNAMEHIKAKKKNALFGGLLGAIADVFMATRGVNTGGYYTSRYASLGSQAFSQDFEREADYVGLYAMALAGAPLEEAPRFWRHMAQASPKAIKLAYTHPTTAERFVRMEHAILEIESKRAEHVALQPERKGRHRNEAAETSSEVQLAATRPEPASVASEPAPPSRPALDAASLSSLRSAPARSEPVDSSLNEPLRQPDNRYPLAPQLGEIDPRSRPDAVLSQDVGFRRVVDDVRRLGILAEYREAQPGLLIVRVGPGFGISSTEYNLARLLAAYRGTVEWTPTAVLDLWQGNRRIGAYGREGLRLTSGPALE